ncbi:MAG: cytochrome b N-terminal domain-containing protein [Rhodospirillales bacterium]|nr:cytochrome b N-terminal domain-containing protein [Rhodospirillales bacterium]MCB9980222.1 cytochrome b N-terminal domain-containing protein [Rhodospirillales bacterium]
MSGGERVQFDNKVIDWIDQRLPLFTLMKREYGVFPTPKNFNYFWNFGALSFFMLITMIITGIFLAMNFDPQMDGAFSSIDRIMRDVNWGWMLRYIHMNGASMFFIAVYIHIYRGMYYGSYKNPRELLWILGVVIFLLMMATAFIGYSMTMSQMGGWAATVITNLFTAIPFVGDSILYLLLGDYTVSNATVNRFFVLHFLLPFVIFAVVFLHVAALHITGSNNPTGIEPKGPQDTVPFHPYYTTKDIFGLGVFLIVYAYFVFYAPLAFSHPDHFVEYDPMVTPAHIVPEWYFLPFYAILRSVIFEGLFAPLIVLQWIGISAKLAGVLAMIGSIAILLVLPWLDRHPVRSARYRPLFKIFFLIWAANVVLLGYLGALTADATIFGIPAYLIGQFSTLYYFAFFLVILPVLSKVEKAKPLPASISEAVLNKKSLIKGAGSE